MLPKQHGATPRLNPGWLASVQMGVGDRHGQRIGGIGANRGDARQQNLEHGLDLCLLRSAGADDGLLHQRRRIFRDSQPGTGKSQQADAPRLPQLERGLGVLVDEDLFHCTRFRSVAQQHCGQFAIEHDQPLGQRHLGIGLHLAVGNVAEPVAALGDDPPAGTAEGRIEADDDQPSCSITASGIS